MAGGAGGSGVVILKYNKAYAATFSAGVTATTTIDGDNKVSVVTATSTTSETVEFGLDVAFMMEYLVVAGGGGGESFNAGVAWGGGGGGGQSSISTLQTSKGILYGVTVGAGGAGGTGSSGADGTVGNNSTFLTVTSSGGAKGQASPSAGSGNGGANAGSNGWGGVGIASTISGSSTKYVGGGSYGNPTGLEPAESGGSYGGGVTKPTGPVSAPTANRGGGGGGGQNIAEGGTYAGQAGGSGVVILKYPDTFTATFSAGVTQSTSTAGGFSVSTITATSTTSETVVFA
jgi:hypothetical protein